MPRADDLARGPRPRPRDRRARRPSARARVGEVGRRHVVGRRVLQRARRVDGLGDHLRPRDRCARGRRQRRRSARRARPRAPSSVAVQVAVEAVAREDRALDERRGDASSEPPADSQQSVSRAELACALGDRRGRDPRRLGVEVLAARRGRRAAGARPASGSAPPTPPCAWPRRESSSACSARGSHVLALEDADASVSALGWRRAATSR